jgi:TM2 domain-containing membrane protein YozV
MIDPIVYTASMNDHQRTWFYAEFQRARKDEVVGVLLAVFLGGFGIHHFYLHRNGLGVLYLLFSWTGIPFILGLIEAFFMPTRVQQYNASQAAYIASQILGSTGHSPAPVTAPATAAPHCNACGANIEPDASFCPNCGAAVAHPFHTQPAV